ncbi:putative acyltransferase CST26 [Hypsizygus marmoreus]|uniref:Acyltransferase CST26 n=1 Tax=Hypsizygus marmoreus TaxID=39966 RepID=A0A369K6I8_HYPMA|nr:putative acyltransferase CST26 [Hypsizygus marmoreus]
MILMCQWFAPTTLRVTFETEGKGRFTQEEIERVVVRDEAGEVTSLNLPTKFVLISNHQIYADWWYAWCLTYFIGSKGVHRHVYITLKKSLQWIPIVGWGMQLFNFIFLARSWASDRVHLASHLSSLGQHAEEEDNPLCFILYPEGTLVSKNTRPISKKFADKSGISDLHNLLLPRSTGLHYSLRSLAPRIPDLKLIDLTMVYPGIAPLKYGQDYYTLRSIFMNGVSPPTINIHLRMFDVADVIPIGNMSANPSRNLVDAPNEHSPEVDIPEQEKVEFDVWLRELWQEKDEGLTRFFETASFGSCHAPVDIPLRLRRKREFLDAFCFFLPAAGGYLWKKLRQ